MQGGLSAETLASFRTSFESHPTARMMLNAVTMNPITDVAIQRDIITSTDHTFSHRLDAWSVTNQKRSGRCWLFAGLNLLRVGAMRAMNLEDFEFSQNYLLFWDKLERANYFLETIAATADRPLDDCTVAWLLDRPLDDGGQWNMFVNIVRKHGLVPKAVMPETNSSSNTGQMNALLLTKLRRAASTIRRLAEQGKNDQIESEKIEIMADVFRMLSIHLGTPPAEFDWQWNDKDKVFHRDGAMTPRQFADKYVTIPLDEYVCLVNDTRETSPVGRTYTVDCLGNVVGGEIVKYLNVDADTMKRIAMKTIMAGEPVWMGCDVGKMMKRDLGIWDAELFDYERVYSTSLDMSKADRLDYHDTLMTHAMLFTGVDVVDSPHGEVPRRWRVENSWGDADGKKGFYVMNDSWFSEYMFEIAARRSALPKELQDALDQEPIVLPAWDPMGALAY
ncbi:MAG TPA: aminopeptidase [Phycisphaerales bacterium]|nr:aminopeptidase [Phycisphaerales bacterium]